jgi:hypothetical protein
MRAPEYTSSFAPYDPLNKRADHQDFMISETLRWRASDATTRGVGQAAILSVTGGLLNASFDTTLRSHETIHLNPKQTLALGDVSLRNYMTLRDTPPQPVLPTEAVILGSAEQRT